MLFSVIPMTRVVDYGWGLRLEARGKVIACSAMAMMTRTKVGQAEPLTMAATMPKKATLSQPAQKMMLPVLKDIGGRAAVGVAARVKFHADDESDRDDGEEHADADPDEERLGMFGPGLVGKDDEEQDGHEGAFAHEERGPDDTHLGETAVHRGRFELQVDHCYSPATVISVR